jgi:hypothetical protein
MCHIYFEESYNPIWSMHFSAIIVSFCHFHVSCKVQLSMKSNCLNCLLLNYTYCIIDHASFYIKNLTVSYTLVIVDHVSICLPGTLYYSRSWTMYHDLPGTLYYSRSWTMYHGVYQKPCTTVYHELCIMVYQELCIIVYYMYIIDHVSWYTSPLVP